MNITFSVQSISETSQEVRTIESEAEALKQAIISKYYELSNSTTQNEQHDRIILTAGVVIDD